MKLHAEQYRPAALRKGIMEIVVEMQRGGLKLKARELHQCGDSAAEPMAPLSRLPISGLRELPLEPALRMKAQSGKATAM